VPTAIAEQNSYAGLTNRILSRFAKKVFLNFEDDYQQFPVQKTTVVGNPIRSSIQPHDYPETTRPFCILTTGGSLGAVALNTVFCEALELLKPRWSELSIVHQTGDVDFKERQQFYASRPTLKAQCFNFIGEMQTEYQKAMLIICRAGASTATEIALSAKPALFVPYPFAADDHQTKNAHYYVKRQAAWMIPQNKLSAEDLAKRIEYWMDHPEELRSTAKIMGATAKAGADIIIAKTLYDMGVPYV
jgi:UDP-N-acetylglucosamine--N-acetylmuramyl-(pentapeptide) pyrophosphoryl-undecaprenol N-acetylglucosamine transferase